MDVTELKYKDKKFDVIIDKSTLDAVLCSENSNENIVKMINEIQRVLKVNGYYIMITHGCPEKRKFYLETNNLSF